jgi:hypothetical protein
VNYPPLFVTPPIITFSVKVGDAWTYTLPETMDAENEAVAIKAEIGTMVTFMTFSGNTFNVPAGVTTESMVKAYSIVVTLTDTNGGSSTTTLSFNLLTAV